MTTIQLFDTEQAYLNAADEHAVMHIADFYLHLLRKEVDTTAGEIELLDPDFDELFS